MSTVAEFISPGDARWKNFLGQVQHDFYHLPEYVQFAAGYEGGEPLAFWGQAGDSACLIPLLRKPLPARLEAPRNWTDVCSPYGYPSPLVSPQGQDGFEQFLPAFVELGRQNDMISAFLRLHPLLPLKLEKSSGFGDLLRHGETVVIDLSLPNEEIWHQTRKNHRTGIHKLLRSGFEATINDWSRFDEFKAVYRETMHRVGAEDYYHFSDAYFEGLKQALQEKLSLCSILAPNGDVAAAGLFTIYNGLVEFHLAGTAEKYLSWAPTKLMFDFVRRWAKDLGNRMFHLGGGVGGEADPLYHFKAGFSEQRRTFQTLRLVLARRRYDELCSHARSFESAAGPIEETFFPCYRIGGKSG